MKVIPNHTFETAPQPKVGGVGGTQSGRSPAMFDWLKKVSVNADSSNEKKSDGAEIRGNYLKCKAGQLLKNAVASQIL